MASYRFANDGLPAEPNYPTTMRRYSYDTGTKKYSLLSSTNINNHRVEALTIDKDSTGRVWATWQQANRIYLNVTGTDGKTWGTPFPHPSSLSNVSVDDTSALIAFDGKMGVMWSRQAGDATDGMYWSYHVDGADDTAWTTPVAAVKGQRSGDDHMNLKWLDSSGDQVFAAVKTSFTSASQPLIQLLGFNSTTSTWSAHTIATVAECPNRVIVLIDESTRMLRTFATYPKPGGTTNAGVCTSSGGAIYEKSTPLDNIDFSAATKTPRIVDADQYVHNVTSTKQNLNSTTRGTTNSGLLLLADANATSMYWYYYDPSSSGGSTDTTVPTVTAVSPDAGTTAVAVTASVTGTFSEALDPSTVTADTFTLTAGTTSVAATVAYDSAGNIATLDPAADLAAGTEYTATIKGGTSGVKDVAGNALAADKTWTFTTVPPPAAQTPIAAKATSLNGALGAATTPEVYGLKDNGGYQCFERGCILYSPATGAHISLGAIRGLWAATGFENGRLGYPVTDEVAGLRDGGVYQNYQGGAIIWSPATGAHISLGAIRGLWAATGFENGRLGYPVTDEVAGLRDGGVYQNYQGGTIIWSPATGAHISVGGIRTIWASTGYESGRLGYPTSDEYSTGDDGSMAQNYQGGVIHWSPNGSHISWL
ncbi:Ig-like domain-containing protein [Pseudarthrobacter sp. NamE5]|uniref:Ig-like domain-containing protein n=1 Tax=Pseudarthrobacter sp. NamE5 TaxID=2576839 RepID=UPI001F0EEB76|nr:Ig-like domain-containing protein [Pseudarthrobacter sp. NamE5]